MKKTLILLAGLAMSTAAIAQDAPPAPPAPPADATLPAGPESGATAPAPGDTTAPEPTDATAPTDAAGAPNAGPSAASGLPAPTTADMSSYPRCGRGQTDKCVQSEGRRTTAHRARRHR